MDDEEAQPADNHLALPHPLGQLTLPRLVDMDLDYAVFVKHRTKRAKLPAHMHSVMTTCMVAPVRL